MSAIPRAVSRTIWIPANSFIVTVGTPSLSVQASRWAGFNMGDSATSVVASAVPLPAFWASMDVDLYWTIAGTPTTGADTVRWVVNLDRAGPGDSLGVSGGAGASTMDLVAPSANVLAVTRMFTARAVDPTKLLNVRVERDGALAQDTLVGNAAFLGVRLRRNQANTNVDA